MEVPNDQDADFSFLIQLKDKCRFILNDCYFTIHKELFVKHPDSDYFDIDLYEQYNDDTEENRIDKAKSKIQKAVDLLVYITNVPYEMSYIKEDNEILQMPIDTNYSRKKIERLNTINSQYGQIQGKRELLENTLRLFALAKKHDFMLEDAEEAYFAYFRIVEKIAKDEFSIECGTINRGNEDIKNMIQKIIAESYKIKLSENKINDLSGNFTKSLFADVFSNIYAKIAWFCARKNIDYNAEELSAAVKIRNALAHGDSVSITTFSKEYKLISELAERFIYQKFFNNIPLCYLESRVSFDDDYE